MQNNFRTPILLLLIFVILLSCGIKKDFINNLNSNKIVVLGHRGMGKNHIHPGNTLQAISTAINIGADGSEIDVQVTKDSVLVLYHNKDLSSLTNYDGAIINYTWQELDNCSYITDNNDLYKLISVDQLFSAIPDIQKYYFSFDCKFNYGDLDTTEYYNAFVYGINQALEDYKMYGKIFVEAGNKTFHRQLKEHSQVLQFVTGSNVNSTIPIAEELNLFGIGIGSAISSKDIELAHKNGFRVMTWAPKSWLGNIKAVKKGPDIIQTSKVRHMVGLLIKADLSMKGMINKSFIMDKSGQ